MTRAANVQAFINRHARHFEQVHLATGIPPSVIVAQSALETGWGSSTLYREGNNLFAFRYYARHPYFVQLSGGKYAGYDSFDDSAEDYIWLMTRAEWSNPDQRPRFREWAGYTAVIEAARALYPGTSDLDATMNRAMATCEALGASKFCEGGGYNNTTHGVGGKLKQIIAANDLIALDPKIKIAPYVPGQPGEAGPPVDSYPKETLWERFAGDLAQTWRDITGAVAKAAGDALRPAAKAFSVLGLIIIVSLALKLFLGRSGQDSGK